MDRGRAEQEWFEWKKINFLVDTFMDDLVVGLCNGFFDEVTKLENTINIWERIDLKLYVGFQ